MSSERQIGYLQGMGSNVIRLGAISMILALIVYIIPLALDHGISMAGRGIGHTGPMVSTDRINLLIVSGMMTCLVVIPLVGLFMGMMGIYRQKREVELSFLASLMHATLLAALCTMLQNSSDANAYMNIMHLALSGAFI